MSLRVVLASLMLVAVVDGFRMKSKRRQTSKQAEDPEIDPEEDAGDNDQLRRDTEQTQNELLPEFILTPGQFPSCHLSESECNIRDLTGPTLVYSDSPESTRCMSGEPFAFLVKPGRTDKLLYYFPNGGACWETPFALPGIVPICLPTMTLGLTVTGLGMGVSEFDRQGNGFADYTFVSPPYCSGGAHVANTTSNGLFGNYTQFDYNNNAFTIGWAMQNMDDILENFVMAGSSAGALGTMAWANVLLDRFNYKKATVIVDSYVGLFPDGTQGPTIKNFEVCNLPVLEGFEAECEAGTATIQDIFDNAIASHPEVAFAIIQPKFDLVQRVFYAAIAASYLSLDLYQSSTYFYEQTNDMLQRYGRHHNFVNYYVDGGFHTFLWIPLYYSATVTGVTGLLGKGSQPSMSEWVNGLIEHEPVQSACNGPLQKNGGNRLIFKNTRYCDRNLYPKTLSVVPPVPTPAPPPRDCPIYCFVCVLSSCRSCCS